MAKCNVTVIGMASRARGVNKTTGADFDFCNVAFSYVNMWGKDSVCCVRLNGDDLDEFSVQVGKKYMASVMEFRDSGKVFIDLISEVHY